MPLKRKRDRRPTVLSIELESRLVDGMDFFCEDEAWNLDSGFRKELWLLYRDELVAQWGDVTKLYGWYEFEASPEERAAFRHDECPSPGYAVRDGEPTVATPANPSLQALRASQKAKMIPNADEVVR